MGFPEYLAVAKPHRKSAGRIVLESGILSRMLFLKDVFQDLRLSYLDF